MDREDLLMIIGIAKKENLQKLDLSNRDISEIPDEISSLTHLTELNLSYNSIKELPDSIASLSNLRKLFLLRNEIEKLPATIGLLPKLEQLEISHNNLTELPPEIGDLGELKNLDASYCKLESLPVEFINLLSLKTLSLENNPIVFPNEKIIKRGLYATMHFLNEVKRSRETAKVVVQVFNLPQNMKPAFKEYLECFHDIVSAKSEKPFNFDVNFIAQNKEEPASKDMDNYMLDFVSFIKQNLDSFGDKSVAPSKESILNLQFMDLKKQLIGLGNVLESRKSEMDAVQSDLKRIEKLLEGFKE